MLTLELRNSVREAIREFKDDLANTRELEIMGWIEICHTVNYMEGAYQLNQLLEEKRNAQRDA